MDPQQLADTPETGPAAELTQTDAASQIESLLGDPDSQEHPEPVEASDTKPEATEPEPSEPPEPKFKVKVHGEEQDVPLSELLKGYSRQADYSRKTEALSQETQALQQQKQTVEQQRAQYEQGLQQTAAVLTAQLQQFQGVDWQKLADTDPIGYLQAKERQREIQEAIGQTQHKAALLYQHKVSERHQAYGQLLQSEQQKVLEALPEWKDESKAQAEKKALVEYLVTQGVPERDLFPQVDPRTGDIVSPGLVDHRQLLLARKAMLFDKFMASSNVAAKRVAPLPKTVQRAGTDGESMSEREATLRRFNKSGDTIDAVAAIAARL